MARTFRKHAFTDITRYVSPVNDEGVPVELKYGWKHSRVMLTQEDYAKARVLRGDAITKKLSCGGIPFWLRNRAEKTHRQTVKQQLLLSLEALEEAVMVNKPDSLDWYYWY